MERFYLYRKFHDSAELYLLIYKPCLFCSFGCRLFLISHWSLKNFSLPSSQIAFAHFKVWQGEHISMGWLSDRENLLFQSFKVFFLKGFL